jgi:hypothetical protein
MSDTFVVCITETYTVHTGIYLPLALLHNWKTVVPEDYMGAQNDAIDTAISNTVDDVEYWQQ